MKEVKKIAKYLGIFIVALIAYDQLFGFVMDRFWNNMPDTVSQTAKTNTFLNKVQADVIILGSSRAAHHYVPSILEDSLGMSVYNCGHEGMDLIYSDAILESVIKRYVPRIVILDMAESYLKGDCKDRLDGLTPYINSNSYIAGILKELKGNSYFALKICNMYRYNDRLLNMINAYSSAQEINNGYTPLMGTSSVVGKEPKPLDSISTAEVDIQEKVHLLHLIETCKVNGISLFIVDSPRYCVADEDLAYTKSIVISPEVTFMNFSRLLIDTPEEFRDSGHLLYTGAELFSRTLASELKRLYNGYF